MGFPHLQAEHATSSLFVTEAGSVNNVSIINPTLKAKFVLCHDVSLQSNRQERTRRASHGSEDTNFSVIPACLKYLKYVTKIC